MDLDEDMESAENESVYNQTVYDERVLVQNWRFALEGVMIPCVGIPGIVGIKFFCCQKISTMSLAKSINGKNG